LLAFAACTTKIYLPTDANVNKRETASWLTCSKATTYLRPSVGNVMDIDKPENFLLGSGQRSCRRWGQSKIDKDQVSLVYKYVVNF